MGCRIAQIPRFRGAVVLLRVTVVDSQTLAFDGLPWPTTTRLPSNSVRFGVFELDACTGELRKQGVRIKLQGQPFAVLLILLEKSGQLITREELQQRLWPADTFVEFDKGIYNAIKRLRETLGDEAETPRYIETIPKRGYRFLAEVHEIGTNASSAPVEQPPPAMGLATSDLRQGTIGASVLRALPDSYREALSTGAARAQSGKRRAHWAGIAAAAVVFLCSISLWQLSRKHGKSALPSIEVVPLLALHGMQGLPAFSPDGNQVAFGEYEGEDGAIYTRSHRRWQTVAADGEIRCLLPDMVPG